MCVQIHSFHPIALNPPLSLCLTHTQLQYCCWAAHLCSCHCRKLSLSSNSIERMVRLELPRLRILSLGRNRIKRVDGLQAVAGTLEQLWLSYNEITSLDGLLCCHKLQTLFISHNKIKTWEEVAKLVCDVIIFILAWVRAGQLRIIWHVDAKSMVERVCLRFTSSCIHSILPIYVFFHCIHGHRKQWTHWRMCSSWGTQFTTTAIWKMRKLYGSGYTYT